LLIYLLSTNINSYRPISYYYNRQKRLKGHVITLMW